MSRAMLEEPVSAREHEAPRDVSRQRLRVLVSAYAVSPIRGSEPGIGWNITHRLAKHHDITVLTCSGTFDPHRQEIEQYLRTHGEIPGLRFHFVEPPALTRLLDRKSSSALRALTYVGYASWQRAAFREARQLHQRQPFDVVHQLNICTYREPSYLWKLPAPFVWGPIAGASNMPWRHFRLLSGRDRVAYGLRNVANGFQKLMLRPRRAARKAAHIFVVGEDNRHLIEDRFGAACEMMFEVGTAAREHAEVKQYDPAREPLRLIWAGLHVGRKAIPIAIQAIARLPRARRLSMTLLGTGPEKPKWQALAERLGVADRFEWIAELPHAQALARMSKAHVFVFPSLQEASATVLMEALSLGLPVVCHDACGMGLAAREDCGIKVPMRSAEESIEGFTEALRRFLECPGEVARLSRGALRRAEELSWDRKAERIAEVYDTVHRAFHDGAVKR